MILTEQNQQPENSSGRAARTLCYLVRHRASYFLNSSCFLILLSGCKYDGSFMQMNSDSGSPFFGLQLAVKRDSHDVPVLTAHQGNSENRPSFMLRSRGQFDAVQLTSDRPSTESPGKITRGNHLLDATPASHPTSDLIVNASEAVKSPNDSGDQNPDEFSDLTPCGHLPERRPVTAAEVHRQLNDF